MQLLAHKTTVFSGQVIVPSSKSQTIRALIFALLSKGQSTLINTLESQDTQDAIAVCKQLGATILYKDNSLWLTSVGIPLLNQTKHIYSGNSGITTHFILPILGLRQQSTLPIYMDCGEQMRARPIQPLVEALNQLGLTIHYLKQTGTCPIRITGALKGGNSQVDGLNSQYLSALLITLPCAPQDSQITVKHLHERPYVTMTLDWLTQQNIQYQHTYHQDTDVFYIQGQQQYQSFKKIINGDFSSAACLIAAAVLLPGDVTLCGLDSQDTQGDKRLIPILQDMGADIRLSDNQIIIRGGKPLRGMEIDANDIPDLLPILAVIGTQASGKMHLYNVRQARFKETDRIHSMTVGLTHMQIRVDAQVDSMTIYQGELKGAAVQGFDDHRTVMALALAGMLANGETQISDAQAINKTFPSFIELMCTLGANLELQNESSRE